MSRIKALKEFQQRAVDSAVDLFCNNRDLLQVDPTHLSSRQATVTQNGYLLIEAPTGSGKTLMAGQIVERFSSEDAVVWFWFAPFKGVITQTESFLREQFQGLRLLDLESDRMSTGFRSGDVFVTTWASVATSNKEARRARTSGELTPSLDEMVASLHDRGFRIGVVVDEAHHGFKSGTQAYSFFNEVLNPEYAILITATPDDKDIEVFRKASGVERINRITISRIDAVGSGLIKSGVKCIAYLADPDKKSLVDFELTALRDASRLHLKLKQELIEAGVELTPLMLVQVDSSKNSVESAKNKLLQQGFREDQIAVHTAKEPDPNLLALANDESKEVLIFKMAVALGFDAPRAFTLVSMRASQDVDFGVQIVGRILRVHRRLQGKICKEILNYGYVFLADCNVQKGIAEAGQRINRLETAYAKISPLAAVVRIGETNTVQVLDAGGQSHLLQAPTPPAVVAPTSAAQDQPQLAGNEELPFSLEVLTGQKSTFSYPQSNGGVQLKVGNGIHEAKLALPDRWEYPLKQGIPQVFKREHLPLAFQGIEQECADRFILSTDNMIQAMADEVKVKKVTLEVFTHQQQLELADATLSNKEVALLAQSVLLKSGVFDPRTLKKLLLGSVKKAFDRHGLSRQVNSDEGLEGALNRLLAGNPSLLEKAQKEALANHTTVELAESLPESITCNHPLPPSLKNSYGVIPEGLNRWETAFALLLDSDLEGTVKWWHRNDRQKSWSCSLVLPDGRNFYPDFIIGVEGRNTEENLLLVDTKEAFTRSSEVIKSGAAHKVYGNVMILTQYGDTQNYEWYTVRYDSRTRTAARDRLFHVDLMKIH